MSKHGTAAIVELIAWIVCGFAIFNHYGIGHLSVLLLGGCLFSLIRLVYKEGK